VADRKGQHVRRRCQILQYWSEHIVGYQRILKGLRLCKTPLCRLRLLSFQGFRLGVNFTNILQAAFIYSQFGFVIFWWKNIGAKAACKMLVKLTITQLDLVVWFKAWANFHYCPRCPKIIAHFKSDPKIINLLFLLSSLDPWYDSHTMWLLIFRLQNWIVKTNLKIIKHTFVLKSNILAENITIIVLTSPCVFSSSLYYRVC